MIVKKVKKMLVEVKDFHLLDSDKILYLISGKNFDIALRKL